MDRYITHIKYMIIAGLTAIVFLMQGCYYDKHEYLFPVTCDSVNVTYSLTIDPILIANCTSCHSGANAPNNVVLDNYAGVKIIAANGLLLGVVTHAPGFAQMPKDADKLSECNIALIKKWIDDGAPDN